MRKAEKDCFGLLNNVFPMGREGLREIASNCRSCPEVKACLQAALATKEGLALRGEVLERAARSGFLGRLKLWSEKKELSRLIKENKDEK